MKSVRKEDRIIESLKKLYDDNGYKYYKMRKFEEYSLYMENKNFLSNDHIITFNHNGKLLALKPDVTLSIVKNSKAYKEYTEKLYYREGVYRYERKSHEYKEINQIGLEVVGKIDFATDLEILSLALKSLDVISDKSMLCVSNTGVISGLFSYLKIESFEMRSQIINCIRDKNKHEIEKILKDNNLFSEDSKLLFKLIDGEIPIVEETKESAELLLQTIKCMNSLGYENRIKIDFSVINDLDYYNGTVFNGYIDGIPKAILSGGRYDGLVEKFGAKVNAEGFAIYLDDLLYLDESIDFDVDVLLLYNENDNAVDVLKKAEDIVKNGETVRISLNEPEGFKYKRKELF